MSANLRVDVWADLVCPWCYLGKRRFERAVKGLSSGQKVEVIHHAFQLDPTFPRGQTVDQADILIQKYRKSPAQVEQMQRQLEQTAAAEGLPYRLVGAKTGNTWDAHQVVQLAQARGLQEAVLERLYRAHFIEQRSLFDPASLAALAQEAGLEGDEVREVLQENRYSDAVSQDIGKARELGITGVPFFVFQGQYGVSGAQPPEVFAQVFQKLTAP